MDKPMKGEKDMRERMIEGILYAKRVYKTKVGEVVVEVCCTCSPDTIISYSTEKNRSLNCPICGATTTMDRLRKKLLR